jgi:hypothetical protein
LPRRIDRRDQIGKDAAESSHVGDQASRSDDPFNPPGLAGAGIGTCGKNPNGGKAVTAQSAARSHRERAVDRNMQTGRLSWRQPFETNPARLLVDTPHVTGVGVDIHLDISA